MKTPNVRHAVPFGILSGEDVQTGDHIAYFWESEREFDRGVQFLTAGLEADDHCVVFGHDADSTPGQHRVGQTGMAADVI